MVEGSISSTSFDRPGDGLNRKAGKMSTLRRAIAYKDEQDPRNKGWAIRLDFADGHDESGPIEGASSTTAKWWLEQNVIARGGRWAEPTWLTEENGYWMWQAPPEAPERLPLRKRRPSIDEQFAAAKLEVEYAVGSLTTRALRENRTWHQFELLRDEYQKTAFLLALHEQWLADLIPRLAFGAPKGPGKYVVFDNKGSRQACRVSLEVDDDTRSLVAICRDLKTNHEVSTDIYAFYGVTLNEEPEIP